MHGSLELMQSCISGVLENGVFSFETVLEPRCIVCSIFGGGILSEDY